MKNCYIELLEEGQDYCFEKQEFFMNKFGLKPLHNWGIIYVDGRKSLNTAIIEANFIVKKHFKKFKTNCKGFRIVQKVNKFGNYNILYTERVRG